MGSDAVTIEIALLVSLVGIFLSIATFFIGRQGSARAEGEWKGQLNQKLTNFSEDLKELKELIEENSKNNRDSIREIHERLDEHLRSEHNMAVAKRR